MVLRAAERLHALAGLRPGLVDVAGDRRRADEADGRDAWVLEDGVDRDLVSVDDVEHTVRKAGFLEELGHENRCRRVLLGRLQDERVSAGDRRCPHPHGHHRGEVEGGDPGDDSERLADRIDVDPGRDLLRVAALQELGDPADVLDHLDAALHLAVRVGEHLAVLCRQEARDVVAVLVDELVDAEEELRALRERPVTPRRERLRRDADRAIQLLHRGEVDLARLLPRRRVVDGALATRLAPHVLSADPVADQLELRRHRCVHLDPPRARVLVVLA